MASKTGHYLHGRHAGTLNLDTLTGAIVPMLVPVPVPVHILTPKLVLGILGDEQLPRLLQRLQQLLLLLSRGHCRHHPTSLHELSVLRQHQNVLHPRALLVVVLVTKLLLDIRCLAHGMQSWPALLTSEAG